jgi:hypothetical protein
MRLARAAAWLAVLSALLIAACGSKSKPHESNARKTQREYCKANGWIYEPATNTCKVPSKTTQTTTQAQPSTSAPSASTRKCGDESQSGSDSAVDIQAEGVGCGEARKVARGVTIEGADAPLGYQCPDANTYAAKLQTCTKGDAKVSWSVQFE